MPSSAKISKSFTNSLSDQRTSSVAELEVIPVKLTDSTALRRSFLPGSGGLPAQGGVCLFVSVGHPTLDAECLNTTVVVVLGMHRSGTSSVAGTLVRLGGAAPKHLMAPNVDNEKGYCESLVIRDLNDAILAAGGSDWKDWRKFDLDRIVALKADALQGRAKTALAGEFGGAGLAVMKDPRMCRLMPFWRPVFDDVKWSVRALLPIRSPLEVGWSLGRRDRLTPAYGCLLWLRHVLDAEAETRGMARAILDWPQFLGDSRKALARANEQLGVTWPYWGESALADIDRFVSADLRRQRASEADLAAHAAVNDLVRRTYAAMLDLVQDPGDSRTLRTLDDLRAGFETASAIFDCPMREAKDEVREVRSQAAAEIARIQAVAACAADGSRDPTTPRSRFFLKPRSKRALALLAVAEHLEAIRKSLFFNSAYYLETNPDVRTAGMDPAFHYLVHGGREGRDPGPFFSSKAYLARYPDVAEAGVNALLHYETRGRGENRIVAG